MEMWQAFEQAADTSADESSYQQRPKRRRAASPNSRVADDLAHALKDYTAVPVSVKHDPDAAVVAAGATSLGGGGEGEGAPEVTLQVCMRLLQDPAHSLQERPPHITEEVNPYMLFMESPKQKRTAGKWAGLQGGRIDRWANSGGVSGAHDYFLSAKPDAPIGVRKRYGRIVRVGLPLLKFFEFTLLRRASSNAEKVEDKSTVLFQVFSETSRAAPGKRHWETSESREGGTGDAQSRATDAGWARRRKELQRLKDLYERGLLTETVYEEEQRRALSLPPRVQSASAALPSSSLPATSPQITRLRKCVPPSSGAAGGAATVVGPLDALLKASTMMLGVDGASKITAAYEETANNDDMWWRAALQWWCIGEDARATQGRSAAAAIWRKCLAAFEKMTHKAAPEVQIVYDFVEYFCIQAVLLSFDDPSDIDKYRSRLDYLAQTEHGRRPENSGTIAGMIFACDVIPALYDHGDIARANAGLMMMLDLQMSVVHLDIVSDEMLKRKHLRSFVWTIAWKDILVLSDDFSWSMLGDDGSLISTAIEGAKDDGSADSLRLTSSGAAAPENTYASYPLAAPLAFVWCNLETADRAIDSQLLILKRSLEVSDKQTEALTYVHAAYLWPYVLHLLGRNADAAQMLRSLNMSWNTADATMDRLAVTISKSMFRPRDDVGTGGRYLNSVTYFSIMIKMSYVLVAAGEQDQEGADVPTEAEVMAAMPTASELLAMGDTGGKLQSGQLNYASTPLTLAEVCERYGAYERAIDLAKLGFPSADQVVEYSGKAGNDKAGSSTSTANEHDNRLTPSDAAADEATIASEPRARGHTCDIRPSVHISAGTIIGRCLARQGKVKEAINSFETAIRLAERYDYKLLQLFALRDMKATLSAALASSEEVTASTAADGESAVAARMAKTLSTLSAQARRYPKLSELLGEKVMELCRSSDPADLADSAEP